MNGSAVATEAMPAPSGYEQLFERDGPYIRKLVRRELGFAASEQDVEDAAQYIGEKLLSRDVLAMYNPHDASGASWHTFLGKQIILYCRGLREDIGKRARREPLQVDAPAGDGSARWSDLYAPGQWDYDPDLGDEELVTRLRAYLKTVPESWQPPGPVRLTELFEAVVTSTRNGERARIGRAGLTALKRALQAAVRRPVKLPARGGGTITVTSEDVATAVEVLVASTKGTAVRQPLVRAGSPLADMDYHAVAAAERRSHPKLRTVLAGSRQEHTGHVKAAVLHHLRRLLAEEFTPEEPEPEPTDEELFEAELWHFPGMTPQKLDQLKEMARNLPRGDEDDNAG